MLYIHFRIQVLMTFFLKKKNTHNEYPSWIFGQRNVLLLLDLFKVRTKVG